MKNLLLLVACAFVFASPAFAQKTSMQYLAEGSVYYMNGDKGNEERRIEET